MRAVFYARVSTEEEEQLHAVEKQIEENRDIISAKGWILVDEYIDKGITGTQTRKRNEYRRMLEDIRKDRFDVIVAKDQSRLQRNTMDWYLFLNEIIQYQKKLYLYLENTFFDAKNKFLFGIKAMMAEEYSRDLSRKGNAAQKRRQEKGKPILTNRTWGYRTRDGQIFIEKGEAAMILHIYQLFADGLGGRAAARVLREEGIRNRNGNTLSENTIRAIVKNPLYKGTAVMNKQHFDFEAKKTVKNPQSEWIYREGIVPRIVPDDLWEKANAQIDSRKTTGRPHTGGINRGNTLLSSKIICGVCGSKYWRNKRVQGIYWYCSEGVRSVREEQKAGTKCASMHLKEADLLSFLEQAGRQLLAEDRIEQLLSRCIRIIYERLSDSGRKAEPEDIRRQTEQLRKRKETLMDLVLDGTITRSDYRSRMEDITRQLTMLKEKEEDLRTKEDKEALSFRLNRVRTLFLEKREKGIEVPLLCAHLERIMVYEKRLDFYFDFLDNTEFVTAEFDHTRRKKSYDMPFRVGRSLPGRCEGDSGGWPRSGKPQREP